MKRTSLGLGLTLFFGTATAQAGGGHDQQTKGAVQTTQPQDAAQRIERRLTGRVVDVTGDTVYVASASGAVIPIEVRPSTVVDAACYGGTRGALEQRFDTGDKVDVVFTVRQAASGELANVAQTLDHQG
jgi:hypothetical protein